MADLYNDGRRTQKFHLENYLKFKLLNGSITETDDFWSTSYRYIRNAALILYIRETVFGEPESKLQELYQPITKCYDKRRKNGGIDVNTYSGCAQS